MEESDGPPRKKRRIGRPATPSHKNKNGALDDGSAGIYATGSYLDATKSALKRAISDEEKIACKRFQMEGTYQREIVKHLGVNDNFTKLGEGSFGKVYGSSVVENGTETEVAIKIVSCQFEGANFEKRWKRRIQKELYFLHKLQHRNIVRFIRPHLFLKNDDDKKEQVSPSLDYHCAFMTERCEMDLKALLSMLSNLKNKKNHFGIPATFNLAEVKNLGEQIHSALAYMHREHGVVHHDIKPANIMVKSYKPAKEDGALTRLEYKLIDFGLAKKYRKPGRDEPEVMDTYAGGSPYYMSLEKLAVANGDKYPTKYQPFKADSFSLAFTLLEALFGKQAIHNKIATFKSDKLYLARVALELMIDNFTVDELLTTYKNTVNNIVTMLRHENRRITAADESIAW